MIIPFIALFFRSIVLRETKSICNIAMQQINVNDRKEKQRIQSK